MKDSELRKLGANYKSNIAQKDIFARITVAGKEGRFVTGQNQKSAINDNYNPG